MTAETVGEIARGYCADGSPFVPRTQCYRCGRFVGREGHISVGTFEMSTTVAYVEGECTRCSGLPDPADTPAEEDHRG